MSANEVMTPKKYVKPSLENCKVCGITTQINARAVISNPAGKTNLGKNFQAYCSIDVGEEKEGSAYCCRNCKLKLETIVKKILEMRELFCKTSKEKVKRLHLPTGESPLAKKVCVNKDSEQSAPVAKRGLGFAASRGENVTRNINAVEEKVAHNPTTELRNINLQENSIPSINKQFSQWNGPPLPRQLFPFYSIFQPPLTVVPIVNFSRPVVKTLSLLIEYNTGLIEKKQIPASRQSVGLTLPTATDDNVGKAVMENETLKKSCVANVLTELNTECSQLCSVNDPSMLRCKAESQIVNFKFADFVNKELKERASLFHQFLFAVACPPGASRNTVKTPEKKILGIAMAAGILMKARNKHMSLAQVVTSLILHNGGLSEMVRTRQQEKDWWFKVYI